MGGVGEIHSVHVRVRLTGRRGRSTHTYTNTQSSTCTHRDAVPLALLPPRAAAAAPRPRQQLLLPLLLSPTDPELVTQRPRPLLSLLVLVGVGRPEADARLPRPRDGRQHQQPQTQPPLPAHFVAAAGPPAPQRRRRGSWALTASFCCGGLCGVGRRRRRRWWWRHHGRLLRVRCRGPRPHGTDRDGVGGWTTHVSSLSFLRLLPPVWVVVDYWKGSAGRSIHRRRPSIRLPTRGRVASRPVHVPAMKAGAPLPASVGV